MFPLLLRYMLYFGVFVLLVRLPQMLNLTWLKIDIEMMASCAPLFLSVLLIDITYRIGKRQNDIAKRQNEIAEQQAELQKQQNEFVKQQIEIQQRQCEIEEYEIYKVIHRDIYELSKQSNLVLPMIYCYVASDTAKDQANNVKDLEKEFTGLFKKLAVDDADFILRKGKSDLITDACAYACFVEYLLGVVTTYKKKNRPEQSDLTFLNYNRLHLSSDEDYVNTINLYIPHDHTLRQMIDKFVEEKNRLFDSKDNLLERIRKSYKNEIN